MEIPKSCAECHELKTSLLQNLCYCDRTLYPVSDPANGRPYFCPYGISCNAISASVTATKIKQFYDSATYAFKMDENPNKPTSISQTSYKMGRGSVMNSIKPKRIIRQGPATIIFWDDPMKNEQEKTVVKCMKDDHYDLYAAFCIAVCKKLFGSNSRIKSMIKKAVKVQEEIEAKKAKKGKKK